LQPRKVSPPSVLIARALLDQLERGGGVPANRLATFGSELDRIDALEDAGRKREGFAALATVVESATAESSDPRRVGLLASSLRDLAR
jgi:hypothetical protein